MVYRFRFCALLFICCVVCMCSTYQPIPENHPAIAKAILESFTDSFANLPGTGHTGKIVYSDFVKAHGRELALKGKPLYLKGICFGNQVWYNNKIPLTHHAEKDYARIAGWGANCVRFYMNEHWFVAEDGFKWIDTNIKWAKANNILLILNMHIPPGGFQSEGKGGRLWMDKRNREKLLDLWKRIARRYSNETTIAGYDILNEPRPPAGFHKDDWEALAQDIVAAIRGEDANHLIIVERLLVIDWDWILYARGPLNFVPVDDANIMYTFHFYEPQAYTYQGWGWPAAILSKMVGRYPNPDYAEFPGDLVVLDASRKAEPELLENGKYRLTSQPYLLRNPLIETARPRLALNNPDEHISRLTVRELYRNMNHTRDVISLEKIDKHTKWESCRFFPKMGYTYTVSCEAESRGVPETGLYLEFEWQPVMQYLSVPLYSLELSRDYVEAQILKYVWFSETFN